MKILISVLSAVTLLGASAIVIGAEIVGWHSMSQGDFSHTQQVDTHYQFSDNSPKSGAIIEVYHQEINQNQHDLSQTYAVSNEYDFANNPSIATQWIDDNKQVFTQSQHDKSMSKC